MASLIDFKASAARTRTWLKSRDGKKSQQLDAMVQEAQVANAKRVEMLAKFEVWTPPIVCPPRSCMIYIVVRNLPRYKELKVN